MYKNYIEMTGQPDQQLLTATEKSMEGLVYKENLDFAAATMHILFCEIYKRSS